jgi:hypothetical protein
MCASAAPIVCGSCVDANEAIVDMEIRGRQRLGARLTRGGGTACQLKVGAGPCRMRTTRAAANTTNSTSITTINTTTNTITSTEALCEATVRVYIFMSLCLLPGYASSRDLRCYPPRL